MKSMMKNKAQWEESDGIIFILSFDRVMKSVFPGAMTFELSFEWSDESNLMNVLGKSFLSKDPKDRK